MNVIKGTTAEENNTEEKKKKESHPKRVGNACIEARDQSHENIKIRRLSQVGPHFPPT